MENGEKLTITMVSESKFDNDCSRVEYTRTLNEEEGVFLQDAVEVVRDMLKAVGYSSESIDVIVDSGLDAYEKWLEERFGKEEETTDGK